MSDTYVCAVCKREFMKARSDEEAIAEARTLFQEPELSDAGIACDDCFKEMAKFYGRKLEANA